MLVLIDKYFKKVVQVLIELNEHFEIPVPFVCSYPF